MANNNLKSTRNKQKMTQMELAAEIGITRWQVQLLESGLKNPTKEEADKIAKILKSKPTEIFSHISRLAITSVGRGSGC